MDAFVYNRHYDKITLINVGNMQQATQNFFIYTFNLFHFAFTLSVLKSYCVSHFDKCYG
jgi:hypothetical protein